ncbi:MAG: polysaccharide deacetylase family protein, partial [Armatimonadota bacterium]|nr:polysaccharide deacetylase family protein [Armatimonadota bacterium]
ADLEARVWSALRLRPSRKVAEWTLANLLDKQGDHASADAHRAVAAALDANYKDARRVARAVFGGTAAALRAVSNAQPLGLTIGSTAHKQVALTFDDGPNPLKTPALLDALDKADALATFFVVGSRAEAAPELIQRMAARGDDVEDHSYTHPNMAQSPPAVAEAEILRTSIIIRALSGRQPRFFRPPGGNRDLVVYQLSRAYGQTVALWTVDALHYEEVGTPQSLISYVMAHVKPGCIVLMHNGMDTTTAAVPGLIAALRAKGYEPVTLTQLTSGTAPIKAVSIKKPRPAMP